MPNVFDTNIAPLILKLLLPMLDGWLASFMLGINPFHLSVVPNRALPFCTDQKWQHFFFFTCHCFFVFYNFCKLQTQCKDGTEDSLSLINQTHTTTLTSECIGSPADANVSTEVCDVGPASGRAFRLKRFAKQIHKMLRRRLFCHLFFHKSITENSRIYL